MMIVVVVALFHIFLGRKRDIVKSPSLNIDYSNAVNTSTNATDEELLLAIEHQILTDDSKTIQYSYSGNFSLEIYYLFNCFATF